MLKCFCCRICDDLLTVRFLLAAYFLHPWRNFFLLLKNLLYNGGCISKISVSVSVRHCSLITIGLNGHCPQIFSVLFHGICSISSVKYLVHKPNWNKQQQKKKTRFCSEHLLFSSPKLEKNTIYYGAHHALSALFCFLIYLGR